MLGFALLNPTYKNHKAIDNLVGWAKCNAAQHQRLKEKWGGESLRPIDKICIRD